MSTTNTSIDRIIAASNAITDDDVQDTAAPDTQQTPRTPYVSKTVTKEERERLEEIRGKENTWVQFMTNIHSMMDTANEADVLEKVEDFNSKFTLEMLWDEIDEIRDNVLERYTTHDYNAIMNDLRKALEHIDESPAPRLMGLPPFGAYGAVMDDIAIYYDALLTLELPTDEAIELIRAAQDAAYAKRQATAPSIETRITRYGLDYVAPRDRVSHALWANELSERPTTLTTSAKKRKELTVTAAVSFSEIQKDGQITIYSGKDFTPDDEMVHNAVLSLYLDGNDIVTAQMIYRKMWGNPQAKITESVALSIIESVRKLSFARVTINTDGERTAYPTLNRKYEAALLHADIVTATLNGVLTQDAIRVYTTPILWQYADAKDHVSRIATRILNTPINKAPDVQAIQHYLIKRIEDMKAKGTISYKGIYEILGIIGDDPGSRKRKATARGYTKRILDHFVETGYILSYKENPKIKNRITSIEVIKRNAKAKNK